MESGFLMLPETIPTVPTSVPGPTETISEPEPIPAGPMPATLSMPQPPGPETITSVRFAFEATRTQLFKVWNAIANLADKTGKVKVQVDAESMDGIDPTWLRNAVEEPFDEAEISVEKKD